MPQSARTTDCVKRPTVVAAQILAPLDLAGVPDIAAADRSLSPSRAPLLGHAVPRCIGHELRPRVRWRGLWLVVSLARSGLPCAGSLTRHVRRNGHDRQPNAPFRCRHQHNRGVACVLLGWQHRWKHRDGRALLLMIASSHVNTGWPPPRHPAPDGAWAGCGHPEFPGPNPTGSGEAMGSLSSAAGGSRVCN